jgi:hypothetical protein
MYDSSESEPAEKTAHPSSAFLLQEANVLLDYWIDAGQRSILLLDKQRQHGNKVSGTMRGTQRTTQKYIAGASAWGRRDLKSHIRQTRAAAFREKCIGSAAPRRSSFRCAVQPVIEINLTRVPSR